jgi:TPR repeat protein
MKTGTATHTAGWDILLCAVFCLLAILPFGYAQSITELKSKAEDGDVQAQLVLAKAYDLGEGVPKDEEKAVQWWEKAAEQGDVTAEGNLGTAYGLGMGVPRDEVPVSRKV